MKRRIRRTAIKYYVATRFENRDQHRAMQREMGSRGHGITFDWTGLPRAALGGEDTLASISALELAGVREAHVLIGLLPGGRGTHVELGAALGLRIPAVLYAEDTTNPQILAPSQADGQGCLFYHADGVVEVVTGPWSQETVRAIADAAERAAGESRT